MKDTFYLRLSQKFYVVVSIMTIYNKEAHELITMSNIIIEFSEKEECTLDGANNIKEINDNGVLSVINPSKISRIWNARLNVSKTEGTDIQAGEYFIGEIEPEASWTKNYSLKVNEPLLKLTETIDTYSIGSQVLHQAFCFEKEMPVVIKIVVENVSEFPVENIRLEKQLPDGFAPPTLNVDTGKISYNEDERKIIWNVGKLDVKGKATAIVETKTTRTSTEPVRMGEINLYYELHGYSRTQAETTFKALTKYAFFLDNIQSEEDPEKWICKLEFQNQSDIDCLLEKITVTKNGEEILKMESDEEVRAESTWTHEFEIVSKEVPQLEKSVEFTVMSEVQRKLKGHIRKEDTVLPVVAVQQEKSIEPIEVPAYEKTAMTVIATVKNVGSATIDQIEVTDVIPRHFKPPDPNEVEIFVSDRKVDKDLDVKLEPPDQNSSMEHVLKIKINNLTENYGGLTPGKDVKIIYKMTAWKPLPEITYVAPIHVIGYAKPAGPGAEDATQPSEPQIKIRYARRSVRSGKQYEPGKERGEYIITLVVNNTGEVTLEKVHVKDFIPKEFEVIEWVPKTAKVSVETEEEERYLLWEITKIPAGETLELEYTVKGKGPYVSREPKVIIPEEYLE